MNKSNVIESIKENRIVAVVRADDKNTTFKIVEACLEGGINHIEITFTIPQAHLMIEQLNKEFNKDIVLGAGTVLDSETARIAILSGAKFVVSPYFNKEMIKLCNRYQVASMPGAMTIQEVVQSLEYGCEIIKLFPGELSGPKIIKAIKGPLPQANLMPTGGVDRDNVLEWINAGAVAVGVGGSLIAPAKQDKFGEITKRAKEFMHLIKNS